MAVSGLDGLTYAARSITLADLEDAITDLRDFDAIDELHIFHVFPSMNSLISNAGTYAVHSHKDKIR